MLKLSRQTDYAILLIESLADKRDYIPLSHLVDETRLPQRFLARIASQLAKYKIIESKEGKAGGYRLTKGAGSVSLFDFLQIFEGNISFARCSEYGYKCKFNSLCQHRTFIRQKLDNVVGITLKNYKLSDII